jgi:hypothetical protein
VLFKDSKQGLLGESRTASPIGGIGVALGLNLICGTLDVFDGWGLLD